MILLECHRQQCGSDWANLLNKPYEQNDGTSFQGRLELGLPDHPPGVPRCGPSSSPQVPLATGKMVFLIKVVLDPQICGFCGSNTVPPDKQMLFLKNRQMSVTEVNFSLALSQVS